MNNQKTPQKSERIYSALVIAFIGVSLMILIFKQMTIRELLFTPFGISIIVLCLLPIITFFLAAIGLIGKNEVVSVKTSDKGIFRRKKIFSIIYFLVMGVLSIQIWHHSNLDNNISLYLGMAFIFGGGYLLMSYFKEKKVIKPPGN